MQCISSLQYPSVLCDPLSQNLGLIEWLPHSDTLHTLIRDYRESKKIIASFGQHR